MAQHFLLTAAARSLSLGAIMRMSDEQAHAKFQAIRWADNGGEPFCPVCECTKVYAFTTRPLWMCRDYISGKYLGAYAGEMAWKEDNRRVANGAQHQATTAAVLAHPVSRVWCCYWQR
jgi:hypothetical protein